MEPQDWLPRLGFGLMWCLLGASLIRFATLLGFPPFLWWLCFLLITVHWTFAFTIVVLASGWLSVEGFAAARLAFIFVGLLSTGVVLYGDKDLPGRQNAADKLKKGLKDARALKKKVRRLRRRSNRHQQKQLQGPALASLLTWPRACLAGGLRRPVHSRAGACRTAAGGGEAQRADVDQPLPHCALVCTGAGSPGAGSQGVMVQH